MDQLTRVRATQPTLADFKRVRRNSADLAANLSDADATAQSMPDASPAKWHLAHTTWFFEEFILVPELGDRARFDPNYAYLFNSYYDAVGARHARPQRGLLTRPSLEEVLAYRAAIDMQMIGLIETKGAEIGALLALGLAHEEQHQELLLTDILHLFSHNPLAPCVFDPASLPVSNVTPATPIRWQGIAAGQYAVGHDGAGFAFDCEGPCHDVLIRPFEIANRVVTCGEWLNFIKAGGYNQSEHWLSDGYSVVKSEDWRAPLYWMEGENGWDMMTLYGRRPVDLHAPVAHLSFYEADAYARWSGARLPTEFEWEVARTSLGVPGGAEERPRCPQRPSDPKTEFDVGDVWEWTASPFIAYPGFKPASGAIGEYNGKFMSGQMVLRGGSCVTPRGHVRTTYRNFFAPDKRWQFSGLRLARDVS